MDNPLHYVSVRWAGLASSVSLNDVPLISDPDGAGIVMDYPIDPWLMPTDNVLGIFLQWPRGVPYQPGVASGEAHVYIHDPAEETPTPLVSLARFEWPVPVGPEFYPFNVRLPLKIERPPPAELWKRAEVIKELSEQDRRAIETLVSDMLDACRRRDAVAAYSLQEYKWRDMARVDRRDYDRVMRVGASQLEWLMQRPGLTVVDGAMPLQIDLVAGGRMVAVTRVTGGSPARLVDDEATSYEIPIHASRLEGRWTLVR
jgi:hypothetical protein